MCHPPFGNGKQTATAPAVTTATVPAIIPASCASEGDLLGTIGLLKLLLAESRGRLALADECYRDAAEEAACQRRRADAYEAELDQIPDEPDRPGPWTWIIAGLLIYVATVMVSFRVGQAHPRIEQPVVAWNTTAVNELGEGE